VFGTVRASSSLARRFRPAPLPARRLGTASSSFAEALTAALAAELEEDNRRVSSATLAAVAQQYEDAEGFGPNALRALAQKFYKSPRFVPSEVHAALAALPFSLILTTCQDDLLAELQEPGSLVLSENDLLDFLVAIVAERPPLPNSLIRALKRVGQSFLFVGFGIRHWYLRVLLKVLVRALELHRTGSAIATEPLRGLSDSDREQTILFYQRGTRIELEDTDISAFLTELAQRLAAEGGFAEQAAPVGPRPRAFISYAREDGDLAAMVFDALQKANFEPWLDRDALSGGEL
jgi:SIR2-like domain